MFLIIDNYDSFVHNLARYFENAGQKTRIIRNDKITIDEIRALKPKALILSPGPRAPKDAGICVDAIKALCTEMPILGICLGHQAIGEAFGAETSRAGTPIHGKASEIKHNQKTIFKNLPTPMLVGRYHSLILEPAKDSPLNITARTTDDNEIMAVQHKNLPVYGLQFHPESILTSHGENLIENFIKLTANWHKNKSKNKLKSQPKAKAKAKDSKKEKVA